MYRGVRYCDPLRCWVASIRVNNVRHDLGEFETAEEAARAYDVKARELLGEWATTNFKDVESSSVDDGKSATQSRVAPRSTEPLGSSASLCGV